MTDSLRSDSEPQTVEEAFARWDSSAYPTNSRRDAFFAGAAWARTPTLPAGRTEGALLVAYALATFDASNVNPGFTERQALAYWIFDTLAEHDPDDVLGWALQCEAGDRPPAEREETQP